ncbi:MAG: CoB--CoM heterodisulfide reductase iron-sulfur subunit A family protein [Bacteroidales bacterium]|nr:CoB--CoM heterodisulfide reductase iron-sulfur subunit A family protein [Bacteroidales bacterium]
MPEKQDEHIVIVGAGTAGCTAAGQLAREGYRISLIEKESKPGGKVNNWYQLFPDRRKSEEVLKYLLGEIDNPLINISLNTDIDSIIKEKKKFLVTTTHGELLPADAILLATGFDLFNPERKEEYGYGIYDDVITSVELEDKFHSGAILTSKGVPPKRVGIVHCVGSRDEKVGNFHCSKVCCVTAVKQAIEIREMLPGTEVFCFYMDMRMFGPYYEELYREAQEKWGVNFIRGKVSEASENIEGRLLIKVEDTLAGRPLKMQVDLLVLMIGIENSLSGKRIAEDLDLKIGINGFFSVLDNHYGNNLSNMEGVFFAGTCTAAMNITDTISHARAAVVEIDSYLKSQKKEVEV